MSRLLPLVVSLIVVHTVAWLLVFLFVVGFEPHLVLSYFVMGWTFTGLELPTLVWLFSWPVFACVLLAYVLGKRRNRAAASDT